MTVSIFVLVLAVVLLGLAAFKTPEPTQLSYGWAGLFLLAIVEILGRAHL